MRLGHAGTEITAAALLQQKLNRQRSEIGGHRRARPLRQSDVVLLAKIRAPVHIDIGLPGADRPHQDQFFFQQLFHLQSRPVRWPVHQRGVQYPSLQTFLQCFTVMHFGAGGDGRMLFP